MNDMNKYIVCALFCCAILAAGCGDSEKATQPIVVESDLVLSLSDDQVSIGNQAGATVRINEIDDLFFISMDVMFDTSLIIIDSVINPPASLLGADAIGLGQPIPGGLSIGFGRTQTAANDNVSGTGDLFTIFFTAAAHGSTEFQVTNIVIRDEQGTEHPDLDALSVTSDSLTIP